LELSELNITGCEKVTAASALGLIAAAGKCAFAFKRFHRHPSRSFNNYGSVRDEDYYDYSEDHYNEDDDDDDDVDDYEVDHEERDPMLDAQFESLSMNQAFCRLPYLNAVKVKMSGVGVWGTKLIRLAGMLQEYDLYMHHFTSKFF
jgi:hypothetical protein